MDREQYGAHDPINVIVKFENSTEKSLTILKWLTPFEGFIGDMFLVKYEGDLAIRYVGVLVKRGSPEASDCSITISSHIKTALLNKLELLVKTIDDGFTTTNAPS